MEFQNNRHIKPAINITTVSPFDRTPHRIHRVQTIINPACCLSLKINERQKLNKNYNHLNYKKSNKIQMYHVAVLRYNVMYCARLLFSLYLYRPLLLW